MKQTDYFGDITHRPIYSLYLDTLSSSSYFTAALPSIESTQTCFFPYIHAHMEEHVAELLFTEYKDINGCQKFTRGSDLLSVSSHFSPPYVFFNTSPLIQGYTAL